MYEFRCEPIISSGFCLLGVEVLTRLRRDVSDIEKFINSLSVCEKEELLSRQINMIGGLKSWFISNNIFCTINVDGDMLSCLCNNQNILRKIISMPFLKMEVNENYPGLDDIENDMMFSYLSSTNCQKKLWLDDVGKGHATIAVAASGFFDAIKIDKQFYWDSVGNNEFYSQIRKIKIRCKKIIIEGVESRKQVLPMHKAGVWGFQGYAFPAIPLSDIRKIQKHYPL